MLLHFLRDTPLPAAYHPKHSAVSFQLLPPPGSLARVLRSILEVELLDVPEEIRFEHRRMEITDGILCPHQNVRACQKNHGLIVRENLLHVIEGFFPLLIAGAESCRR